MAGSIIEPATAKLRPFLGLVAPKQQNRHCQDSAIKEIDKGFDDYSLTNKLE